MKLNPKKKDHNIKTLKDERSRMNLPVLKQWLLVDVFLFFQKDGKKSRQRLLSNPKSINSLIANRKPQIANRKSQVANRKYGGSVMI